MLLRLIGPGGGTMDIARACEDLGRQVLPTAGRWVIEVYADDMSTGPYALRLLGVAPPRERSISIGELVRDRIGNIGDTNRYRFTAKAGQRILVDTAEPCVGEILWRLLRPDGAAITIGTSCTDSSPQTLDVAGEWVVEVFSETTATGEYSFTVTPAP